MTRIALSSSIEKCFARSGVADDDVLNLVSSAIGCQVYFGMQPGCDISDLLFRQVGKGLHAFVGTPYFEERANLFAFLVVEHQDGTDQVRSAIAPSCVCAVAKTAIHKKRALSTLNRSLVELRYPDSLRLCRGARTR